MSSSDPDDEKNEQVSAEEIVRRRRVKAIENAREEVKEAQVTLGRAIDADEITQKRANIELARLVEMYIQELKPLLESTDVGERYLTDVDIGSYIIQSPHPADMAWKHKKKNDLGNTERDSPGLPQDYDIVGEQPFQKRKMEPSGLAEYLEIPIESTIKHTIEFHISYYGYEEVTEPTTITKPWDISVEAFRSANEFAAEIGLDIQAGTTYHGVV